MSTLDFKKQFDALKGAQPKSSLLNNEEAIAQLGRSVVIPSQSGITSLPLFILCVTAFVAIGTTVYYLLPTKNQNVDVSHQPNTQTGKHTPQEHLAATNIQTDAMPLQKLEPSTLPRLRPLTTSSKASTTPVFTNKKPVTIAGVPFLDLEAQEFAQLPGVLKPEIITQRASTFQNGVQLTEKRSLECLLHSPDASSVVDNGQEYIQTRALFIPIRVQETSSTHRTETVRWYRPTGELIAMLPERYRVRMMIELNLLSEVQRGCITPQEACRALPHSQSYFDMCRMDASRIKDVIVAPNPIRYSGKANVILRYQAELHIALFSTNGSYISELYPQTTLDAGEHELNISTRGIPAGIYLLTVTSSDGEHVVRQIIIE